MDDSRGPVFGWPTEPVIVAAANVVHEIRIDLIRMASHEEQLGRRGRGWRSPHVDREVRIRPEFHARSNPT